MVNWKLQAPEYRSTCPANINNVHMVVYLTYVHRDHIALRIEGL
jgi:hypothetical protein